MIDRVESIPDHIAIIMDGNGRWAKKRLMPRVYGHRKGVDTIKEVTKRANELGIKVLTLYAFSTENWGRPRAEVDYLMKLPKEFFGKFLPELIEKNIKVEVIGNISLLPKETLQVLESVLEQTKECSGMVLNFALNYGSRQEITQSVKEIVNQVLAGEIQFDDINVDTIDNYLETAHYGEYRDPDLIIRTSGEERLSNFLLWQAAYSEFYFTNVLWPDFNKEEFDKAIIEYSARNRRYGKLTDSSLS